MGDVLRAECSYLTLDPELLGEIVRPIPLDESSYDREVAEELDAGAVSQEKKSLRGSTAQEACSVSASLRILESVIAGPQRLAQSPEPSTPRPRLTARRNQRTQVDTADSPLNCKGS